MHRTEREFYSLGDHLVQCDRSGFKCLRSECVLEWDGKLVKREYSEPRHPLDLQIPPREEQVPQDVRAMKEVFVAPGDITRDDL